MAKKQRAYNEKVFRAFCDNDSIMRDFDMNNVELKSMFNIYCETDEGYQEYLEFSKIYFNGGNDGK